MKRPVFSFRPNLRNPDHEAAWEILENVPEGLKTSFVVQAVLHEKEAEYLERLIRKTVREELDGRSFGSCEDRKEPDTVPEPFLNFISMLQEE